MMPQRCANLHPAIDTRVLACAAAHGANFTRLCNAALYLFLESGDEAQADALRIASRMHRQFRDARLRSRAVSAVEEVAA